ncbi:hypothetical protein PDIG_21800 [Penicillium digitatum PHI26]|uniref:Uncharacterized protein n=1 Tax=Penicillium digitatum (strain PHI26 / CECT 20796) TaxID=1170229 RepID=K9G416_PEND2|nr:hypothetical protein PDIG_21800 [Penicillium digitatum PHI26]
MVITKSLPYRESEETASIIAVTQGFLAALSAKSRADFEKHCVRVGGITLSPPTSLRFCTIGSFVEHVAGLKDDINERIWDPEVKVHEAGSLNLAAVWAPFRAKINGVVDQVGVE